MRGMEDEINRLSSELKRIQDLGELEKRTNAQLEIQVAELKEKLNGKNIEVQLEKNVEIAELTKKIKELQVQLDEAEQNYKKKMDESKRDQGRNFLCDLFNKFRNYGQSSLFPQNFNFLFEELSS